MLKILFLTHRFPFPPDRGDRIRSHAIIRHLSGRHRISLAAVVDGGPDESQLKAAEQICASVDVGRVHPVRRLLAPRHLPTPTPLTLPLSFSSSLKVKIAQRMRAECFDLIFVYC